MYRKYLASKNGDRAKQAQSILNALGELYAVGEKLHPDQETVGLSWDRSGHPLLRAEE